MLHAAFSLQRGGLALAVDLQVAAGETLALVGPNGAGKSTCLQAIAGLLPIQHGTIRIGNELLDGGPGLPRVPPERRGVGFLFQDPLLFAGMNVLDNVAYGLRSRGVPRQEARERARQWLERVGAAALAAASPRELSGGQAQRVALARALAPSPRILLLDEPLAAVDASAAPELRREIRAQLAEFTGVRLVVAHSAVDAFALADRIAVLEAGRIVQLGTVAEICAQPRSRYVADLIGLNFCRGVAHDGVVELPDGARLITASTLTGPVLTTIHPRAVSLFPARPAGSPRNVWETPVLAIEPTLERVRVRVGAPMPLVAEITPGAAAELRLAVGGRIWIAVKATEVGVFTG